MFAQYLHDLVYRRQTSFQILKVGRPLINQIRTSDFGLRLRQGSW